MERFLLAKKEILAICVPSSNPDVFTDMEHALDKMEQNLEISLLGIHR